MCTITLSHAAAINNGAAMILNILFVTSLCSIHFPAIGHSKTRRSHNSEKEKFIATA